MKISLVFLFFSLLLTPFVGFAAETLEKQAVIVGIDPVKKRGFLQKISEKLFPTKSLSKSSAPEYIRSIIPLKKNIFAPVKDFLSLQPQLVEFFLNSKFNEKIDLGYQEEEKLTFTGFFKKIYHEGKSAYRHYIKNPYNYIAGNIAHSPEHQYRLALLYLNGIGVKQNLKKAENLIISASKQNYSPALYFLSYFHTDIDKKKAASYYKKAVFYGTAEDKYVFSKDIEKGMTELELEPSSEEAFKWLQRAGLSGHAEASFEVYKHYLNGSDSAVKNHEKAYFWYQLSEVFHQYQKNESSLLGNRLLVLGKEKDLEKQLSGDRLLDIQKQVRELFLKHGIQYETNTVNVIKARKTKLNPKDLEENLCQKSFK